MPHVNVIYSGIAALAEQKVTTLNQADVLACGLHLSSASFFLLFRAQISGIAVLAGQQIIGFVRGVFYIWS